MNELKIKENNGNICIGDNNVIIACHCGLDCHHTIQEVSENVLRRLQLNDVDVGNLDPKVQCLCAVYKDDSQVLLEKHLSRLVIDLVRNNNCTHFEVQLKVTTMCKNCHGNNAETTYASQEFECILTSPRASLNGNKQLELRRVHYPSEVETPFQAFLNKSQNIIKSEGNFIRIISKICENGGKVKIKLRFDVRRSVERRSKSFSGFDSSKSIKFRAENSTSFRNISQISRFSMSSASLQAKTQSTITILDGEVDIQEQERFKQERDKSEPEDDSIKQERGRCEQEREISEQERERSEQERERSERKRKASEQERERSELELESFEQELEKSEPEHDRSAEPNERSMQEPFQENAKDQSKMVNGLDLNELEKQEIFAAGKFGPLYKVTTKEGRQQLVKIVKTRNEGNEAINEKFLKETKEFYKCRHPYVRPTADILEHQGRSFVFYWFLEGLSLFQAIEKHSIKNYVIYCRILFGMVKGLVYLQEKIGIECQYLTPEKVLLDEHFNPRIAGVGLSYFKSKEDKDLKTNIDDLHRSVCYLDVNLRSRKEIHPKNVLWSVGRCIWDMLFGKILCERPGQDLLSEYNILACLEKSCNDSVIKSSYFSDKIRKVVYGAGWPRDKEITKSLVVCAVKCMWRNPEERLSLKDLHRTLKNELRDLQKKVKFTLHEDSTNLCLYCLKNERDTLPLTCGCTTACIDCLRDNSELHCPEHGNHSSKIGHPLTYSVVIQGEFNAGDENKDICANDSVAMENLLRDQSIFAIKNPERIQPKSLGEVRDELKRIKVKFLRGETKAKYGEKYPRTLLLYINGHCNDAGSLKLPDGSTLKKKILSDFIREINPKHLIVLANGHYSEKLVKNLSQGLQKALAFASLRPDVNVQFFGVFSHAGNMCRITHRNISDENSIFVKFILDIFKKPEPENSSNGGDRRYLTAAQLAYEISERMEKICKRLKPVAPYGGSVPIAYI